MKLNLGSNNKRIDGFKNVDIIDSPNVDIVASAHNLNMIEDESVDEILAEHLLEHLTFYQANRALAEWYRVLKTTGSLTIEVPDLESLCKAFLEANEYQRFQSNQGHWGLIHHLYGHQQGRSEEENLAQTHKSGYTLARLQEMLYGVGFSSTVEKYPIKDTPGACVIRIEAIK